MSIEKVNADFTNVSSTGARILELCIMIIAIFISVLSVQKEM
jgi:hypothetical protein